MDPNQLPQGDAVCRIFMIDTACNLVALAKLLVEPHWPGHEYLNLPTYSWLIVNDKTDEHVLFDLGMRKDWENSPPHIVSVVEAVLPGISIDNDVPSVLKANDVELEKISAVILSHWHFDHTGNMALFPKTTKAVFGPDWKKNFGTFYPENEEAVYHGYEFEGREVVELEEKVFKEEVAGLKAYDYFGNGSMFLLHSPGHTADHMTALVRTTVGQNGEGDTFMLLGGDSCHFPGVLRPTRANPLPENLTQSSETESFNPVSLPCPCATWTSHHPRAQDHDEARKLPFYVPSTADPGSFYLDQPLALKTISKLQALDANPNVFVTIAHDPTLGEVLPKLGSGLTVNDWKEAGYKKKAMWGWLKELPRDGKPGMPPLVDGQYRAGKKTKNLDHLV